jgi:recombination protein RecA
MDKTMVLDTLHKRFALEPVLVPPDSPAIPTGIPELDQILGGGIPGGLVTEVSGPAGVGKSTLAMAIVAQAQQAGLSAALVAGEKPLAPEYLGHLGVNLDDLVVYEPTTLEMALEAVRSLLAGGFGLVIVDSAAAFPPRAELEGEVGDFTDGRAEQVWDQAYRCIERTLQSSSGALVLVNQIRKKRGVLFGNPERTVAQEVIAYWAGVRLDLRGVMVLRERGEVIGQRVRARIVKSKVAVPYRVAEFELVYGRGVR